MEHAQGLNHTLWECKCHPESQDIHGTTKEFYLPTWARGYFVSTVGTDEQTIREYDKRQEVEDRRIDQLRMLEEDHL